MYYRSQGYRYPKNMRIPINYGGNAFSNTESATEDKENEEVSAPLADSQIRDAQNTDYQESSPTFLEENTVNNSTSKAPASILKGFANNSLFGGRIGSEELLILALVFLLSDTDDNDIIWLLLLLLFIK